MPRFATSSPRRARNSLFGRSSFDDKVATNDRLAGSVRPFPDLGSLRRASPVRRGIVPGELGRAVVMLGARRDLVANSRTLSWICGSSGENSRSASRRSSPHPLRCSLRRGWERTRRSKPSLRSYCDRLTVRCSHEVACTSPTNRVSAVTKSACSDSARAK